MMYLETNSVDPAFNLAYEEYVLHKKTEHDYLILWQNDSTVVIGRNQNAEEEINKKYIAANDIKVIRRNTGGGAVFHDLGNLNYSFITDVEDESKLNIAYFTKLVVETLKNLGLDAADSGRNDITIQGKKISGTAQCLYKNRILYHGTLLFDSDMSRIEAALNVDETKFESKSAKSVRSRVGNIKDFMDEDMDLMHFWECLKKEMLGHGIEKAKITEDEHREILKLKEEKYDTWQWNFGNVPEFKMKMKKRHPGGTIEIRLEIKKGIVENAAIYGDFLALSPVDEVIELLRGCKFRKKEFEQRLESVNFRKVFGSITKAELLETIFRE